MVKKDARASRRDADAFGVFKPALKRGPALDYRYRGITGFQNKQMFLRVTTVKPKGTLRISMNGYLLGSSHASLRDASRFGAFSNPALKHGPTINCRYRGKDCPR